MKPYWKRKTSHGKKHVFVLFNKLGKRLGTAVESYALWYCSCGCGELVNEDDANRPRFTAYKAGEKLSMYVSLSGARMAVERACGVQSEWMAKQLARIAEGGGRKVEIGS